MWSFWYYATGGTRGRWDEMVISVRPILPRLDQLSPLALKILHILEPVVGRILATAMLRFASSKVPVDVAALEREHLSVLLPHLEQALARCEKESEVQAALLGLAALNAGVE